MVSLPAECGISQPVDEVHRRVQIVLDRRIILRWRRCLQKRGEPGQRTGLRAALDGFQHPLQKGILLLSRFEIGIVGKPCFPVKVSVHGGNDGVAVGAVSLS